MKLISRKLILENLRYLDPSITMSEDVNITLPCLCDCRRLVIAKDCYFYHYRLVADSMSHDFNPKLLTNLELTDKTFREILKDKKIENADEQLDREYVMMLLVIMKNALRSTTGRPESLVKKIFLRPDIRQKVLRTKVDISGMSNKLIYFTMRHPNPAAVGFSKFVIDAYDRRTN